jgi:polysaccharide biosynthesis protein PslH
VQSRLVQDWEARALARLDFSATLCRKDQRLIAAMAPALKQAIIRPWFMVLDETRRNAASHEVKLLFWGAMDRRENAEAAIWAANEILPRVRQAAPQATLHIAGNGGEALRRHFPGRTDITITGFVSDIRELFSEMTLAILPLRLGAGIKVKTLECMAAGIPVVTTSVGVEGVDGVEGVHYLVGEDPDTLAAHVVALINDPVRAAQMASAAREFIGREYDFAGGMDRFESFLGELLTEARSGRGCHCN